MNHASDFGFSIDGQLPQASPSAPTDPHAFVEYARGVLLTFPKAELRSIVDLAIEWFEFDHLGKTEAIAEGIHAKEFGDEADMVTFIVGWADPIIGPDGLDDFLLSVGVLPK